ncbi:hypothetical protein V8C42DRAFT_230442 [Trichoderma barbatum]
MDRAGSSRSSRPLLPAPSTSKQINNPPRPQKKQQATAACDACRKRKSKCSADRPVCSLCTKYGTECIYPGSVAETRSQSMKRKVADLEIENSSHRALYDFLRTRDLRDIDAVVQRIRAGDDVSSVLQHAEEGDLLLQAAQHLSPRHSAPLNRVPSQRRAAWASMPNPNSGLEFELSSLHQIAYPILLPLEVNKLESSPFEDISPSPLAVLATSRQTTPGNSTEPGGALLDGALSNEPSRASDNPIVLHGLEHSHYCDDHLDQLSIAYWTTVPISDSSAATLISVFLDNDQTIVGFFDADLFVEDLVNQRLRFCSSFLVSAVLYVACHAYTGKDVRAAAVGQTLFNDCKYLFRAERSTDDIVTLAAINIFALGCFFHGEDRLGHELLETARQKGKRLSLYGIHPTSPSALEFSQMPSDQIRATSHVAWGTYVWLTIHVLYYHNEPIEFPPVLPIPGDRGKHGPNDTAEPSGSWPLHLLPSYMGRSFTKLCKLFTIVQEVAMVYIVPEIVPISERVPLSFAEAKYQKLLSWMDTIGQDMAWDDNSPAHLFLLHIYFHCTVLDIFRPFQRIDDHRMKSFSSKDSTPQAVFNASVNQLKRLVLVYRSKHMPESYLAYVNASILHLANAVLKDQVNANSRYYFMLSFRYWQHLYVGYPIFGDIARAFLAMAIQCEMISKAEGKTLMRQLEQHGLHHKVQEMMTSSIIVDYDLALRSRAAAQARSIAQMFDELALASEHGTDIVEVEE